eukprot:5966971-Pyramimonas_sp.AAC.1
MPDLIPGEAGGPGRAGGGASELHPARTPGGNPVAGAGPNWQTSSRSGSAVETNSSQRQALYRALPTT